MARIGGAPLPTITDDRALGSAKLERSLRFNRTDSAYITRTVGTTGNRRTWTVSFWMKFCEPTAINNQRIWSNESGDGNGDILKIELYGGTDQARQIGFIDNNHAGSGIRFTTDRGFRDNSWYHIMMAVDTTQATDTNRVKIYVNGDQLSNWLSGSEHNHPPNQNYDTCVNLSGEVNSWGRSFSFGSSTANYFDGYLTEINFIDGQQLSPTDLGFTDPVTGIWMPKKYEGTYGTNGYRLDFSDNSSTAALGIDKSPNGNDFTVNNFSVAAGKNNDSLEDIPTNNFCTMNPLMTNGTEIAGTHSNGNLTWKSDNNYATTQATFPVTTGRWYWECEMESQYVNIAGITRGTSAAENTYIGYDTNGRLFGFGYYYNDGTVKGTTDGLGTTSNNNLATSQTTAANGDILGIASDIANGYLIFYKNGTHIYTITGINNTFDWFPSFSAYGTSATWHVNYGQRPFTYTPPAGHKSLCSRNLVPDASQIVRPKRHFDTLLWTGNATSRNITGLEFKPDLVWIKSRTGAYHHGLFDSVRGEYRVLKSSDTAVEATWTQQLTSFNTDGFSLGDNSDSGNYANINTGNYVAWCWKGGSPKQITSGSVSFNDDGDYLNIGSSSDYAFGTGDYTIEAWVYHTSLDGQQTYVGDTYGNTAGAYFYKTASNRLGVYYSSEISTASESFAVIPLNKWVHVAVSRNSGTTRIFQDGTLATNTGASDTTDLTFTQYYIGDTAQTSGGMIGFISNVRILKGTGLYTSNFTPPTSPLTNISNTVFLGCQSPNSSTTAAVTPGSISANDHAMPSAKNPFDAFCIDGVPHMTASSAGLDGGTIDPTGASINTKAGFSIITYNGNGTSGATVGHGLGVAPKFIITKQRSTDGHHWRTYHAEIGATKSLYLDLTNAQSGSDAGFMNNTEPTSTVFSLGNDTNLNENGQAHIAYCWAEVPGYSKFGTYNANGNGNGAYVSLGFRPAWVLIKNASLGQPWVLIDSKREPYNEAYASLGPNTNNAEYESQGNNGIDFLADGFKIRGHGSGDNNYSSSYPTHVYMAFAEAPSVTPFDTFPNAR